MTAAAIERPLGPLVTENLARARILDSFGLNYYSRGDRSLDAACKEGGLSSTEVLAALARADGPQQDLMPDWNRATITAIAAHVEESHHRYLRRVLPEIAYLLEKIESVHGSRHPELPAVVAAFRRFRSGIETHIAHEEAMFFPKCREFDRTGDPRLGEVLVGILETHASAHLEAEDELQAMRRLTGDFRVPPDAGSSYARTFELLVELEADMHLHLHKENNILFSRIKGHPQAVE